MPVSRGAAGADRETRSRLSVRADMRTHSSTLIGFLLASLAAAAAAGTAPAASPENPPPETPAILVLPADPPSPAELATVRRWHAEVHPALQLLLAAWHGAGRDLERWHWRRSAPGCRQLERALAEHRGAALRPVPQYRLARELGAWLERLERGAQACLADRYFEASYELGEARSEYLRLVRTLARFELAP